MKIVHLCLSCFYIDGFSYQENELVRQHVKEGHDVNVIASTENYSKDNRLTYVEPGQYIGAEGAKVTRLAYKKFLPHSIMKKLRIHGGIGELLTEMDPDVIMFHGLCGWELISVCNFVFENPRIKFYVDSHEDFNNSARSFISKNFLHKIYYKYIIKYCINKIPKVLCISLDVSEFVRDFYGVPEGKLEFYPLGGEVFSDNEYQNMRDRGRKEYNINDGVVLCVQTGKFGKRKKLSESLRAFNKVANKDMKLLLAGVIDSEIEEEVIPLIENNDQIEFVGWKNADEIRALLCASDLYIQPGTQSATMQMSLCARCPVIIDDVLSHQPFVKGNGWLVYDESSLEEALVSARDNFKQLKVMSKKSYQIAKELLDYKELAARILK